MYGEVGSVHYYVCVGGGYACLYTYMHIDVDQVIQTVFHMEHSVTLHCV